MPIVPILIASIFSVFSPSELFYNRVDAQVLATDSSSVVVPDSRDSLERLSDRISQEEMPDEPTSTLRNLVWTESRWDPTAVSKTGDCGLVQINSDINPSQQYVPCEVAKDPNYALHFAARYIKAGLDYQWVACNCYLYVKTRIHNLPKMDAIAPNGPPTVGSVAIFTYHDRVTGVLERHIAVVDHLGAITFTVAETNDVHCLFDRREVAWDDPHLQGFWTPPGQ